MSHLKRGADGHLLKNAAGHLVKVCEVAACSNCDGSESAQYTLTFSGIVICTGCYGSVADSCSAKISTSPSLGILNTTYTVTQTASPCTWELLSGVGDYGSAVYDTWANSTCAGAASGSLTYNRLNVQLIKLSNTQWAVFLLHRNPANGYTEWFDGRKFVTSLDCTGSFTVSNSNCGGCGSGFSGTCNSLPCAGRSGSVTVAPV